MKKIVTAAVAVAAAAALSGCIPTTGGSSSFAKSGSTRPASPTLEDVPVNPYSSNGQWLVPDEIRPGNYRVSLQPGKSTGYGAVCGDFECNPFGEPGMLSNDNYSGPGVMVVPQSAVMVELRGIALTPMGTRP